MPWKYKRLDNTLEVHITGFLLTSLTYILLFRRTAKLNFATPLSSKFAEGLIIFAQRN